MIKRLATGLLILATTIYVDQAVAPNLYAANRGIPDNRVHQFASYLGIPNQGSLASVCTAHDTIYFSCGAYLVDVDSIAPGLGLPERRIILTAGHCVNARDNAEPFIVHFQDGDARVTGDPGCPTRVIGFKTSGFNYYQGTHSWTPYNFGGSGLGVGIGNDDYAIILLDSPVSASDVDQPATVAFTDPPQALDTSDVPILGMAGFGIAGFGDPTKNGFGKPLVIQGPREKMYVEMPTHSVQNTNILSEMIAAQAEQTACNGDSGSALFLPDQVDGSYLVYGHVANGDLHCRATDTATRVDTEAFRAFVRSVADEINAAALE